MYFVRASIYIYKLIYTYVYVLMQLFLFIFFLFPPVLFCFLYLFRGCIYTFIDHFFSSCPSIYVFPIFIWWMLYILIYRLVHYSVFCPVFLLPLPPVSPCFLYLFRGCFYILIYHFSLLPRIYLSCFFFPPPPVLLLCFLYLFRGCFYILICILNFVS